MAIWIGSSYREDTYNYDIDIPKTKTLKTKVNSKRKTLVLKGLNKVFKKLNPYSEEYKALVSAVTYISTDGKCK